LGFSKSKTKNPKNFIENQIIAKDGGSVAANARKEIESRTGKSAISNKNAKILGRTEIKKMR